MLQRGRNAVKSRFNTCSSGATVATKDCPADASRQAPNPRRAASAPHPRSLARVHPNSPTARTAPRPTAKRRPLHPRARRHGPACFQDPPPTPCKAHHPKRPGHLPQLQPPQPRPDHPRNLPGLQPQPTQLLRRLRTTHRNTDTQRLTRPPRALLAPPPQAAPLVSHPNTPQTTPPPTPLPTVQGAARATGLLTGGGSRCPTREPGAGGGKGKRPKAMARESMGELDLCARPPALRGIRGVRPHVRAIYMECPMPSTPSAHA